MTPDRLRDFASRYTAAWCSHDAHSVADFFAPDGSIAVNGAKPAVGRDAIAELVQGFYDAFRTQWSSWTKYGAPPTKRSTRGHTKAPILDLKARVMPLLQRLGGMDLQRHKPRTDIYRHF